MSFIRSYCDYEDFDATAIDNCFESSCSHTCCGKHEPEGFCGATEATESIEEYAYSCTSLGEQVENPGIEAENNRLPIGWITNSTVLVASIVPQGRVHSGQYVVNLKDNGHLSQFIDIDDVSFHAA